MNLVYYCEIDVFCIGILALILFNLPRSPILKTDQKLYKAAVICSVIYSAMDLLTWAFDGKGNSDIMFFLHLSYMAYFITSVMVAYIWVLYILVKIDDTTVLMRKYAFCLSIPAIVFSLLAISSPLTDIIYNVNANGYYERGNGIYSHWVVCFAYLLLGTCIAIRYAIKETSHTRKQELYPLCIFIIFPAICSVLQILSFGTVLIQVGITFALMLIFIKHQNSQISIDILTNTNNRRQLDRYLDERLAVMKPDDEIFLMMIDLDDFKMINDNFGHLIGDKMLVDFARVLKRTCGQLERGLFLARYGGDEFVIVSCAKQIPEPVKVENLIKTGIENYNFEHEEKARKLSASMGFVKGKLKDFASADEIIKIADERMYAEKSRKKNMVLNVK